MDVRKIVVVVEDEEAARTALQWALHNFLRYGDIITLLHVISSSRNKKKLRNLRLKGFQLALSFKDICNTFFNTNIEIVVTEGDEEGGRIVAMVREIGAFALVVGLHDHSFLYRLAMAQNDIANNLNCKVLAIKQPPPVNPPLKTKSAQATALLDRSTNMDFSQIEIATLQVPYIPPPKVPYKICPDPSLVIWRWRKSRRKGGS
ncbi:uncharacterized protein LOC126688085 [Mercurialis annua]|uniref:uncharacterized protein LOC126688085 n=1 Tax=Mercurialis annua TaxID=3986 RepID=UPI00215F9567|nr:uncharacterized protein LOC126688085 [Mercurialis annua]